MAHNPSGRADGNRKKRGSRALTAISVSQLSGEDMRTLQAKFERVLLEAPYRLLADRLAQKLTEAGVQLRPRELEKLVEHLQSNSGEEFRFQTWRWWEDRQLSISLTDEETQEILDRVQTFLDDDLGDLIKSEMEETSHDILRTLHATWKRESGRQERERAGFEKRLVRLWGPAIDRLRMTLTVARELGASHFNDARDSLPSSPHLLEVLFRLHARACQVADEIICLLESGFADGAIARWRTLHEIAAVAFLLQRSGESLAARYLEHEVVESFQAATAYRECSSRLGYEPMTDEEYEATRRARDAAVEKYGRDFGSEYGWAAEVIGKKPTLRDIEEAAQIDHFRAHYRMASHNVHANPKGVFFKLGLLNESEVLLTGRSNAGLAEPGHSCAISLMHVTVALCVLEPTLDVLVALRVLGSLTDEVGDLFSQAHEQLLVGVG